MTRYGFAIKALPKNGKPFGEDEEDPTEETPEEFGPDAASGPTEPPAGPTTPDPAGDPAADAAEAPQEDPAAPPETDAAGPPADDAAEAPLPPPDDARPWSGDMYDEGDESDPASAFAAYNGTAGEEAWLDQAPDGTLTGWVRDSTGQVWRYADADAWAIDVDDAQMTRTHGGGETADPGTAPASNPGEQEPLFPPQ
ncbi:hypothetical protein [Streptomyces sp. NPDC000880]